MSFRSLLISIVAMAGMLSVSVCRGEMKRPVFHLEPNLIPIGASYNGAQADISGEIPENADAVVCVSQEARDFDFFKKGHVLGLFWMNVGEITFKNVPAVYMLYLPGTLPESRVTEMATRKNLAIGYDALEKQAIIMPDEGDRTAKFAEFIRLKASDGFYAVHPDAVVYGTSGKKPGTKTFSCRLKIPSKMKHGVYRVTTYVFKEDGTVQATDQDLKIEETGLPKMITALAFDHGALYGVLSAVIAVAAGLLMGAVFKGEKGAH